MSQTVAIQYPPVMFLVLPPRKVRIACDTTKLHGCSETWSAEIVVKTPSQ